MWNRKENSNISNEENVFENVICEMAQFCLDLNVLNFSKQVPCKYH